MPINQTTATRCSILPLDHPSLPAGLPSIEYKHHTMKSTITGAIQEITTIESNQGTSFEISLDIKPTAFAALHQPDQASHHHRLPEDDYLIYVLLDGINAQRSKRHRSQRTPTRISGVFSQDRSSSRSFQFGSLQLVDPDDHQPSSSALNPTDQQQQMCQDEKIIQALGTIQVNIVRCSLGQPKPVPRRPNRPGGSHSHPCPESLKTTNQMVFSERTKKACQLNTVGLSQPVRNTSSSGHGGGFPGKRSIRPIVREDPQPFLQFIFKYKPRSILEAEGIIAAPPPPPPAPPANNKSTPMTSSPTKPAISEQTSLGHDYQSNSELHKSSLNPNAQAANEVDEKKPKMKEKPVYINIDSDSDSESVPKSVTRAGSGRPQGSTSHPTSNKPFPKPEPRDHDDLTHREVNNHHHKQGNTDSNNRDMLENADSKKRARSTTADVKPNKRVSMGDAPSGGTAAVNASASRDISKTQLKENINIHPTPTTSTKMSTRANGTQQDYRNTSSFEESSDDDDQFKSQIIAPVPSSHSARPTTQLDRSPTKPSPQALNQLNNTFKNQGAARQGPNFFDLTGLDDDSD